MRDFKDQQNIIRQFLLGQLPESESAAFEDRIFGEADFAEEVQIIEDELIAEFREGRMRVDDRDLFESRYCRNTANRLTLEVEETLNEFIQSKSEAAMKLTGLKPSEASQTGTSDELVKPPSEGREEAWFWSIFRTHRALAFAVLLIGVFLSIVVAWLLFGQSRNNPSQARRQEIEAELVRLNTTSAAPFEKPVSTVDLQPSERNGGVMARIDARKGTGDTLIEFRLNVTQARPEKYRAAFVDDRQNELFSVSNLTEQTSSGGPRIQVLVPLKYLNPGDYQIILSLTNKNGGNDEINSYSFRVLD
jgi:anti-sigma-K factor RskA